MSKIRLDSVWNIRDFGGIPTVSGARIRRGRFIRSRTLYGVSDRDAQILCRDFGLKTVVDLRTAQEIAERPDPALPGVAVIPIPLLNDSVLGVTHDRASDRAAARLSERARAVPDMAVLYERIVTHEFALRGLREVFRTICRDGETGTVLWHCAEGKDRCGIVSALFLSLLGVGRDRITADYLRTNVAARPVAARVYQDALAETHDRGFALRLRSLHVADRRYLAAAFAAIDRQYGGTDAFLRDALGVTDAQKARLRELCLVPGNG